MHVVISMVAIAFQSIYIFIALGVLVLAGWGLAQLAMTRDDAFMVIDREKKNWLMLMGGALALSLLSLLVRMEMLWVIAAVIVGIYWQDIRPSIKDVLDNSSGSW
ncbi:MAG TPA: DUF2516 family protein [Candidatus Corynebacterium gallistercoris]|uniref:DUF2516 family protein n=1 Tax=Candidatus Corynebacterium gallistercoris TaxID=2838530 RepID=A0A9D1UPG4_9CORY|nr:DUF2516 family protein [Candidatus Corynebacterium gallistercoris]